MPDVFVLGHTSRLVGRELLVMQARGGMYHSLSPFCNGVFQEMLDVPW